jgi:hypothetical protein
VRHKRIGASESSRTDYGNRKGLFLVCERTPRAATRNAVNAARLIKRPRRHSLWAGEASTANRGARVVSQANINGLCETNPRSLCNSITTRGAFGKRTITIAATYAMAPLSWNLRGKPILRPKRLLEGEGYRCRTGQYPGRGSACRWPAAASDSRVQSSRESGEGGRGGVPAQLVHIVEECNVGPQRGKLAKQ